MHWSDFWTLHDNQGWTASLVWHGAKTIRWTKKELLGHGRAPSFVAFVCYVSCIDNSVAIWSVCYDFKWRLWDNSLPVPGRVQHLGCAVVEIEGGSHWTDHSNTQAGWAALPCNWEQGWVLNHSWGDFPTKVAWTAAFVWNTTSGYLKQRLLGGRPSSVVPPSLLRGTLLNASSPLTRCAWVIKSIWNHYIQGVFFSLGLPLKCLSTEKLI